MNISNRQEGRPEQRNEEDKAKLAAKIAAKAAAKKEAENAEATAKDRTIVKPKKTKKKEEGLDDLLNAGLAKVKKGKK